jgi:hypothetical protein
MSQQEKTAERHGRIVELHLHGVPPGRIAATVGLSEKAVLYAIKKYVSPDTMSKRGGGQSVLDAFDDGLVHLAGPSQTDVRPGSQQMDIGRRPTRINPVRQSA